MTPTERQTSVENLRLEQDAIVLYDSLAAIEKDDRRRAAFQTIATNERRHADIWARRLREAGADVPEHRGPRPRVRLIIALARVLGTRAVSELVQSLEGDEEDIYSDQSSPEVAAIAEDERRHAEIWKRLDAGLDGHPEGAEIAAAAKAMHSGDGATRIFDRGMRTETVAARRGSTAARDEAWHRAGQTGTLRATIFGVNDGLVSNLSLVMGVAGAAQDNSVIVLAGVAGLMAGAFSMGAGEWISMQSQRELFQRQIALEREEMRIMPDVEEAELAGIFRRKGLPEQDAAHMAQHLMEDPESALDTKVREELGLDPDELGSPWGAAIGSFVAFSVGAFVPLLPFLVTRDGPAFFGALVLAFAALFAVGAGVSLLTGRSALFSGLRQVAIGAAAALVTYVVGTLIGVQFGG